MALTKHPRALLAGLPLALALILTGCATEQAAPPVVEAPVVEVEPGYADDDEAEELEVEEEPEVEDVDHYAARWPLTGTGTDEVADRPALLVKVENSANVRPQTGLEFADVLYEIVVEGGITRYVAVYHSDLPESILPVRSARPTDIPVVTPYGGLFAYSGAQPAFIAAINAAGNQSLIFDSGVAGLARVSGRPAPHNVAANPLTLLNQANATRVSPPQGALPFARDVEGASAAQNGTDVATIDVRMSNVQRTVFRWDAAEGRFMRYDGNNRSMQTSGVQLGAVNVILIASDLVISNVPNQSSAVPTNILGGTGRALFATDGKYIEGTWQKGGNEDPFVFLDSAGQPVVFAPGNTFIQIVPNHSGGWTLS